MCKQLNYSDGVNVILEGQYWQGLLSVYAIDYKWYSDQVCKAKYIHKKQAMKSPAYSLLENHQLQFGHFYRNIHSCGLAGK